MKTLTVTISDEAAARLAEHAAEQKRSQEEIAANLLEDAYDGWVESLDAEERAAIEQGLAQAERGETVPHDDVFKELQRKHGW